MQKKDTQTSENTSVLYTKNWGSLWKCSSFTGISPAKGGDTMRNKKIIIIITVDSKAVKSMGYFFCGHLWVWISFLMNPHILLDETIEMSCGKGQSPTPSPWTSKASPYRILPKFFHGESLCQTSLRKYLWRTITFFFSVTGFSHITITWNDRNN